MRPTTANIHIVTSAMVIHMAKMVNAGGGVDRNGGPDLEFTRKKKFVYEEKDFIILGVLS